MVVLFIVVIVINHAQPLLTTDVARNSSALQAIPLEKAYDLQDIIEYTPLHEGQVLVRTRGRSDAFLVLLFVYSVRGEMLQLRLRHLENVHHISVYFGLVGESFSESTRTVINTDITGGRLANPVYYVRLPGGDHDRIRLSLKSRDEFGEAILEPITVKPLEVRNSVLRLFRFTLAAPENRESDRIDGIEPSSDDRSKALYGASITVAECME